MVRTRSVDKGGQVSKDCPCQPTVQDQTISSSSPNRVGGYRKQRFKRNCNFLGNCKEEGFECIRIEGECVQLCQPKVAQCCSEVLALVDLVLLCCRCNYVNYTIFFKLISFLVNSPDTALLVTQEVCSSCPPIALICHPFSFAVTRKAMSFLALFRENNRKYQITAVQVNNNDGVFT